MLTRPPVNGALMANVNVAIPPGGTADSACAATRLADGQPTFIPSALKLVLSPLMPRATSLPATPFCQVFVPELRNRRDTLRVAAACRAGTPLCETRAQR